MAIVARNVCKTFGEPPTRVLQDVNLEVADGEFLALTGRSGSGKSTLLYILSSLDLPTSGSVEVSGVDIAKMKELELHRFRNEQVGFVFQFHYLLAELTALENVLMPTRKLEQWEKRRPYAEFLLESFGLKDKMPNYPRQLSGGELQRVAIARSLVMEPRYLFADEPTGALDSANGDLVMNLIHEVNRNRKTTVVMVTHDPDFAKQAGRQVKLVDGQIASA
jgi:ABC-type lipoprotein export system ATPase subunit